MQMIKEMTFCYIKAYVIKAFFSKIISSIPENTEI